MGYTALNFGLDNKTYTQNMKTQFEYQNKLQNKAFLFSIFGKALDFGGTCLLAALSGSQGANGADGTSGTVQMKANSPAGQKAVQEMTSKLEAINAKISEIDSITGDGYDTEVDKLESSLLNDQGESGVTSNGASMNYAQLQDKLDDIANKETSIKENTTQITSLETEACSLIGSGMTPVKLTAGSHSFTCQVGDDGEFTGPTITEQLESEITRIRGEIESGERISSEDNTNKKLNKTEKSANETLLALLEKNRSNAGAKDAELKQKQADVKAGLAKQKEAEDLRNRNTELEQEIKTAREALGCEYNNDGTYTEPSALTNAKSKLDGSKRTQSKLDALKAKRDHYKKDNSNELDRTKIEAERAPLLDAQNKVQAFLDAAKAAGDAEGKYDQAKSGIKGTRKFSNLFHRGFRKDAKALRQEYKDDKATAKAQMKQNLGPLYQNALTACGTAGIF